MTDFEVAQIISSNRSKALRWNDKYVEGGKYYDYHTKGDVKSKISPFCLQYDDEYEFGDEDDIEIDM